jgi:hypothetical protein
MSGFDGKNYTSISGLHKWLYPLFIYDVSITVKESDTGNFGSPDQQDTITLDDGMYYTTNQDHSTYNLPGTSLFKTIEDKLNASGTLTNTYSLVKASKSYHVGTVQVAFLADNTTTEYQIELTNIEPAFFGLNSSTASSDSSGFVQGDESYLGAWFVDVDRAADMRGFPMRKGRLARGMGSTGDYSQTAAPRDVRDIFYRDVGRVDVWPYRATDSVKTLIPVGDWHEFSSIYTANGDTGERNNALVSLLHYAATDDPVIFVADLGVEPSYDVGKIRVGSYNDHITDYGTAGERYNIEFEFMVTDKNWNH